MKFRLSLLVAGNKTHSLNKYVILAGTLLLTALFVNPATAQVEKGCFFVGGNADISDAFQYKSTNFNFSVAPTFGVFVVKGFGIGGNYSFTIGSARSYDNNSHSYSSVTTFVSLVGPELKYYLGKKALKGVVSVNAGYSVYTALSDGNVYNYNGFSVGGTLGMAYFFNPHISLEMAGYITSAGYQTFLPVTRTGLSVGFYVFLDKKKPE